MFIYVLQDNDGGSSTSSYSSQPSPDLIQKKESAMDPSSVSASSSTFNKYAAGAQAAVAAVNSLLDPAHLIHSVSGAGGGGGGHLMRGGVGPQTTNGNATSMNSVPSHTSTLSNLGQQSQHMQLGALSNAFTGINSSAAHQLDSLSSSHLHSTATMNNTSNGVDVVGSLLSSNAAAAANLLSAHFKNNFKSNLVQPQTASPQLAQLTAPIGSGNSGSQLSKTNSLIPQHLNRNSNCKTFFKVSF